MPSLVYVTADGWCRWWCYRPLNFTVWDAVCLCRCRWQTTFIDSSFRSVARFSKVARRAQFIRIDNSTLYAPLYAIVMRTYCTVTLQYSLHQSTFLGPELTKTKNPHQHFGCLILKTWIITLRNEWMWVRLHVITLANNVHCRRVRHTEQSHGRLTVQMCARGAERPNGRQRWSWVWKFNVIIKFLCAGIEVFAGAPTFMLLSRARTPSTQNATTASVHDYNVMHFILPWKSILYIIRWWMKQ